MRHALVACVMACGGARPAPAVAPTPIAATPADAALDAPGACISVDVVDGPKLAGGGTALEICTLSEEQRIDRGTLYERRAALILHARDGSTARAELGAWREEHDEYYLPTGIELVGAIGDTVLVRRRFGTDEIDGYQLVDGAWSNLGMLASGERVDVVLVDATHAELTACTPARDVAGRAIDPCTPNGTLKATWTGETVEVYP